jgi:kynurenine formamidase
LLSWCRLFDVTTIIDLSQRIEDGMITYPGLPAPSITDHLTREASRLHYAPGYEFHIGTIKLVGNTGTYLDTPFHRYPDGYDLAGLDMRRVCDVPGIVVDVAPGEPVDPSVLAGLDVRGKAVLFRSGWSRYFGTPHYADAAHPGLAAAVAAMLTSAGASIVGIDSVNIDLTSTRERPVHSLLLAAGIPIVEHLTNLDKLVAPFTFTAVPPAVVGMGSFPVRAFATLA